MCRVASVVSRMNMSISLPPVVIWTDDRAFITFSALSRLLKLPDPSGYPPRTMRTPYSLSRLFCDEVVLRSSSSTHRRSTKLMITGS